MPLGPVYKANSPKNVPQLPLSDRFPSSGREVRFKESPDEQSPYSMDLNNPMAPSSSSGSKKMSAGQWVKVDDGNGNQYLLNLVTQETKWPSPVKGSSSQRNSVQWQLLYDAEGNPYYYDESTDQVQWENPWAGGPGGEATTSSSAAPLASLPSGWEAAVDPNTSLKYYFNNQTNESQWTTPQKDMSLSPFRQQEPPQSPAWASAVDPESGAPYYYSSQGETQWNTPAKLKAQRGGASFLPPKDSPGSPYQSGRKYMAPDDSQAEARLPPGWESAVDPESGAPYYYNSITLESRWLPPSSSSSSSSSGAGAGAGSGSGSGSASGRSSKSSARQQLKGLFSEAYFQGLETVPEGDSSNSPRVGQEGDGVRGVGTGLPFGAEATMTRKPSPRASGDLSEFLESKEETQVRKFERMKGSATLLRQLDYGDEEWSEWQMPGGGAVFYSQAGVRGGQWQKPIVFENAAAMARSSGGGSGDVAPGLDPQADRERIEASRLKMDKARLARSFEYGFDAPSSGAAGAGEPDPREAAAERARAGLEMIRKKEQRERDEEAPVFQVDDEEDDDGRVNRSGSALAQRVKAVVTGKIEKNVQQEAYKTLRMRDAAVEQDLQLADVQKRADRAKERWKEFVGPTFSHKDEDGPAPKKAGPGDEDSDYESENDDEDEEGGITVKKGGKRRAGAGAGASRARATAGSKSQSVDFDALYARAIVVRQKWPWTCLVDMKSDRLFYRNEVQDSFQLEAPPEFESQRDRDDRLQRGRNERDEDDEEKEDFARLDKPEIQPGETPADFVTRFKDELKARRDHLVAKKTRDRVVLTTAGQEKALGAAEADEGYEKKARGKSLSASSIVNKIRSFSLANQVLEAAGTAKAVVKSNNRNLFARWSGAPGQAVSKEALARKYAQPKTASQKGGLASSPSTVLSIVAAAPGKGPDPSSAHAHFVYPRDKDAAELLLRLRRLAYERKGLFIDFREKAESKYRKPEKDDKNKGAFQETQDLTAHKRALAINDLRNQEKSIATFVGVLHDQLDISEVSWLESEIYRRHLLEAAVLQRNALVFPRSAREAKCFGALPTYLSTPHSLRLPRDLPALMKNHRVTHVELGVWVQYTVHADCDAGRRLTFFHNSKTCTVQTGEPFDVRCHRKRDAFTHHKWSHYDRFLPMRSNFERKGLHLLSDDEDGGLLFYCPRRDKYSPTDKFDAEVNFASVRAALDAKKKAKSSKHKEVPEKRDPAAVVVPNYPHYRIPQLERDVLEFPEPNPWAGVLRRQPPTHAPSKLLPPRKVLPGASVSLLTPTGRSRQEKKKARPSSATRTRPSSATRTPSARPQSARSARGAMTNSSQPEEESSAVTPDAGSVARRFVAQLDVAHRGRVVRPFSAPINNNSPAQSLLLDTTNYLDGIWGSGSQAGSPSGSGATDHNHDLHDEDKGDGKPPQLAFEFDLDDNSYLDWRTYIAKLSEKPRDPVLLLEMANFLHSTKLGSESLAVVERVLELLADWKLTSENNALCRMLGFKMRLRYRDKCEKLRVVKSLMASCIDAPIPFAYCGQYFHKLKYLDEAEDVYVAALLLDPLCNEANRGLAHLLLERGNPHAASRYFVRVTDTSAAYSMVKAEQGWLQELLGSADEAILLAYKKSLSLGLRDRGTVCTLSSLGHFYHVRGDFARAHSFYKRALMYAPCDPQALLLMGALGNTAPGLFTPAQTDALTRKGVLMQQGDTSRWVALLLQADAMVANQVDLSKAEEQLWEAVRLVFTKEVWPTVSLAHFYQYVQGDVKRARRLLLWASRRNAKLADNMDSTDPPGPGEDDDGDHPDKPLFGDADRASLLVATAFTYLDSGETDRAAQCAKAALELSPTYTSAHRALGLALREDKRSAKQAAAHFQEALRFAGSNAYTYRTASILAAMDSNFSAALRLMETAVQHGPSCGLAWHALGIMSYMYSGGMGRKTDTVLQCLDRAIDLSNQENFDAILLKGQILTELGRHAEARATLQLAMTLAPGEPILLASLALSLSALGFKAPAGERLILDYSAQLERLDSLGELADSENPEELFSAAVLPGLDLRLRKKCQARRAGSEVDVGAAADVEGEAGGDEGTVEASDADPAVLYWFGMYHLNKGSKKAHAKAKAMFTRAVQRVDHPPHPLALYMLGWLAELKADLPTAEKFYCYALQLEPMHPLAFLQLSAVVKDTLKFVRGLVAKIEGAEGARKVAIRRKNKMRQKGISVPVAKEGEGQGHAEELAVAKKRLLLHERVLRLAELRKVQYGSKAKDLVAPGKCVHVDPFWLDRMLHAFSHCDDWACLLRSSPDYTPANQA